MCMCVHLLRSFFLGHFFASKTGEEGDLLAKSRLHQLFVRCILWPAHKGWASTRGPYPRNVLDSSGQSAKV